MTNVETRGISGAGQFHRHHHRPALSCRLHDEAKDADRKLIFFAVFTTVVIAVILAALPRARSRRSTRSPDGVRSLFGGEAAASSRPAPCPSTAFQSAANACYFTIRSGGKTLRVTCFDSFYGLVYAARRAVELGKGVVGLILIKRGLRIHNIVKDQSNEHRVLPEA